MADTELKIKILADDKASAALGGVNDRIQSMSKSLRVVGAGAMAAGTAIVAAATMSIKSYAEMGDEVQKMALRTNWSTKSLSELRHVANITGTELQAFELGTRRMSGAIVDACDGLATYTRAFEKLGLDVEELRQMKPEDAFWAIAYAINDMDNEIDKAALAMDIFGRTGTQLLPMLSEGKEGIAALRQEAHDLGIVFDQEAANEAAQLKDEMQRVTTAIDGVKNTIASSLIPAIMPLIEKVKNVITGIREWAEAHPVLFKSITVVATAIGALLIPLGALAMMLPTLITGFTMLTAVMSPVSWAIIAIASAAGIAALSLTSMSDSMRELEIQTFKTNLQAKLSSEQWERIIERGYMLDEEFIHLARSLKMTKQEFYENMQAAGLVKESITSLTSEGRLYIRNLDDMVQGLNKVEQAMERFEESSESTRVAIATATWQADGYTHRMSLFTQQEIEAAKASGKKVEALGRQIDVTDEGAQSVYNYTDKLRDAIDTTRTYIDVENETIQTSDEVYDSLLEQTSGVMALQQAYGALSVGAKVATLDLDELRKAIEEAATAADKVEAILRYQWAKMGYSSREEYVRGQAEKSKHPGFRERILGDGGDTGTSSGGGGGGGGGAPPAPAPEAPPPEAPAPIPTPPEAPPYPGEPPPDWPVGVPWWQHGGVINEPTLLYGLVSRRPYAVAGESGREYVTPASGQPMVIHNYVMLDGRIVGESVSEYMGKRARLQGMR